MRTAREKRMAERLGSLGDRLYGYAIALTRDRDDAADLFQDCIVRAMSTRSAPSDERAFRAWAFTVMRNLWIDRIRARKRRDAAYDQVNVDQRLESPVGLEAMIVNQFAVREAFSQLSLAHRDVLALIDIAGFGYDEAASMLGVPRGTIMSRVSRARQALAAMLRDDTVADFPQIARRNGNA